ncbi:MAG: hypothetical protein BZ138_05580 [Methanosphaera sp. rholeuAM270]|nr:MAG: hypothetical protein BZ138_05580 [Methanosphaera sp. rholeuAM270]
MEMRNDYTIERFEKDTLLKTIREKYVDFTKTELSCRKCRCHSNNWTCPPFDSNQTDIWSQYENIKLILLKFNFTEKIRKKQFTPEELMEYAFNLHHGEKTIIEPELKELEKELNGHYLTCGPCVNCQQCQRLLNNRCIMPEKRKYAMESLGANIIDITKDYFNIDMQWIKENKLPEYIIMMVSVLY